MPLGSPELSALIAAAQQQQGDEGKRRKKGNAGGDEVPAVAINPDNAQGPGDAAVGTGKGDLFFHTGNFGSKLLEVLGQRIAAGEYGAIYKDISEEMSRAGIDPNNPGGDPNNPGTPDGGPGGAAFGRAGVDGGQQPDGVPGEPGAAGAEGAGGPKPLGLAVVWLGKATSKEEASRLAEAAQVDILVTYEIEVRLARNSEFVNNTTLLRIASVRKGEPIFASKEINNRTVATARGLKEDPVEKEVARAIEALDKVCKVAPLPALTPEQVKARIASLVAEKPANPLPVVVEARYYVAKGLLPEAELFTTAVAAMGEAEYARLIANSPGAGMGQLIGSALSLPGVVNLVRGVNAATSAAGASARRPAEGGEGQQPGSRGLRGLLPFGGPGR
jgi:hypothetical protein